MANKQGESAYYSHIRELSVQIKEQAVSPVDVVRACLQRIDKLNPKLNAFITIAADQAMDQASVAESEVKRGNWRGPLHGIPVGVKDFYDTAGMKTTAAFEHFQNRVPTKDAVGVAKLKEAGAIIIGKMNMHKLGMGTTGLDSFYGPVHNPWNADYIPGGSSSGSAAAVASGMCYTTFDTDAIGSCRLPAACCGVVGFKGTYGLICTTGILEGEESPDETIRWLSHPGVTTRSVSDTALVLDVLAERTAQTRATDFSGAIARARTVRIGVADNIHVDRGVQAAFQRAVDFIQSLGYPMVDTDAPFTDLRRGIGHIQADRKAVAEQSFENIDVLLLPTTATTVPTIRDAGADPQALSAQNTLFANYYGLPAVSVPCGCDANGLPLGLQIVGKPWGEGPVLQLAHQYQVASGHSDQHPTP
jgi:aspartyl-tRNA(Asn)/glutamyl-tRNA(Gln) amidotransferase subunit A